MIRVRFKLTENMDIRKALKAVRDGGEKGIRDCANLLLEESRKQVPIDFGTLSRSGIVDSKGLQATVSYDTPYAARWHENDANFQHGRKKKYLEDPCNDPALRARMLQYLKDDITL